MILIYIEEENPRIKYIFDFIFREILHVEFVFTTDSQFFSTQNSPKFSYGKAALGDEIFFGATPLLFEKEIAVQQINFIKWNGKNVFYKTDKGVLPFDPFACSFFLISRYEEYLPHIKDRHKRFSPEDSIAFQGEFLDSPVVNVWAEEIKNIILARYPDLIFPVIPFTFTPTIDIDNAYAYKYKGFLRTATSLLARLFKLEFGKFYRRIKVLTGSAEDPFDTYEKQRIVHKKYNLKPCYFILLGDYGNHDKNLSHKHPRFISIIQDLQRKADVGMHPSYSSDRHDCGLEKEKLRLEKIIQRPVEKSRHHYIKLNLPKSYRELIKAGIVDDYSMGYPSMAGFRASTCTPFYFFDIENNAYTSLKVFPFVFMDTTLKVYLRLKSREVLPFVKPYVDEVKRFGGSFIFIFHNESMGDERLWKNWGDMYEKIIQLILSKN